MTPHDLNPATRQRLRRHARGLVLWCIAVGFATDWLLLRRAGIENPALRYAIAAAVMYAIGLVLGARAWLAHFHRSVRAAPELGHATPAERAAADAAALARAKRRGDDRPGVLSWPDGLQILELGEAALLLLVPALIVGRTWLIGILMVVASSAFGWTLRWLAPGAVAIGDLWR